MALNYSHRPIFPAHTTEDNLVSPVRIANGYLVEGVPEKGDLYARPGHGTREKDCFDYGRDRSERSGSPESASKDIIDLLPSDPFGMDISTTFTAITGWLEDLEVDCGGYGRSHVAGRNEDYGLFAGLNLIWNSAMTLQGFPGYMLFDGTSYSPPQTGGCYEGKGFNCFASGQNVEGSVNFNTGSTSDFAEKIDTSQEGAGCCSHGDGGALYEALPFALSYLGLRDLLSVERVCKSLHSTVRSDPLLWRSIHIDQPLNERITDDFLLQLTGRAQGNLQCLSLAECPWITDDGLKLILDANPRLTKLCVPGCTRLSIDGILNCLKVFNADKVMPGIKHLRIGGLYGVTHEHFEELKVLLGADRHVQENNHKPHFFHRGNYYMLCDDDRCIDIELCPRCEKLRLVYDCPSETCQAKDNTTGVCRACTLCIQRCFQCGRCINGGEYEETFCLDLLCSDCSKQLHKCQEKQDRKVGFSKKTVHHEPSYNSCLHG
ncbi:hypothetical protein RJ639_008562 [Escallonia herrerae]|uniref:F-box domain-containing protein n=1 Tax=Escallonia herrerae TaxID=1293975 RepID=A0AA89AQM0_9ASTE|nr:hypothetical protein RJ639_008562 [Escallonia herrerae]